MKTLTPQIKIYRNGQIDYLETYKPVLKRLGNAIDYFFVNHEWPKE